MMQCRLTCEADMQCNLKASEQSQEGRKERKGRKEEREAGGAILFLRFKRLERRISGGGERRPRRRSGGRSSAARPHPHIRLHHRVIATVQVYSIRQEH